MANAITRQFTFNFPYSDDPGYQFSLVDQEIQGIVDTVNNADAGLTTWNNVNATNFKLGGTVVTLPISVANGGTGRASLTSGNYLKGNGTGTVNFQAAPIPISDGGTNSTSALVNGKLMASSGGTIIEVGADSSMNSHKITSLANGTAATDAAAFGQLKVLQIVLATTTTNSTTTTSTFASTNLAATITPISSSNRVLVMAQAILVSATNTYILATVFRGATNLAASAANTSMAQATNIGTTAVTVPVALITIDSPATTSATTYTVEIANGNNSSTVQLGNGSLQSIILMEVV